MYRIEDYVLEVITNRALKVLHSTVLRLPFEGMSSLPIYSESCKGNESTCEGEMMLIRRMLIILANNASIELHLNPETGALYANLSRSRCYAGLSIL